MKNQYFNLNAAACLALGVFLFVTTSCVKEPKAVDGVMIRLHEAVFGTSAPKNYHLDSLKEYHIRNERLANVVRGIEDRNSQVEAELLYDHFKNSQFSDIKDLKNILVLKLLSEQSVESGMRHKTTNFIPFVKTTGTYTDSLIVEVFFATDLPRITKISSNLGGVEKDALEFKPYMAKYRFHLDSIQGKTLEGEMRVDIDGQEHTYLFEKEFPKDLHFLGD